MAKQKPKRKTFTYYVSLPQGINVPGYNHINLTGRTEAVSQREAVSHLIARQLPKQVALIMHELDANYGGADNYAFSTPIEPPEILQDTKDLAKGTRLTSHEKRLMQEHALAYNLAVLARADTLNPKVQMDYLDRARFFLKRN